MDCMVKAFASVLELDPEEIYAGVGHREPIHISELVAWFLTRGWALVPKEEPMLTNFPAVVEGCTTQGTPHMVPLEAINTLAEVWIIWYLIPVPVNQQYRVEFERKRDAAETFRMGVSTG